MGLVEMRVKIGAELRLIEMRLQIGPELRFRLRRRVAFTVTSTVKVTLTVSVTVTASVHSCGYRMVAAVAADDDGSYGSYDGDDHSTP